MIIASVIQVVKIDMKRKINITVKNPFVNNCDTMLDTTKRICQLN